MHAVKEIDKTRVPRHVAIIMDGNGRWATRKGLSREKGHIQGYYTLRDIVEASADLGIGVLTVYAFSTENWRRPKAETDALMKLMMDAAHAEAENLHKNGVRMIVSGRLDELPTDSREALESDMEITKDNRRLIFNLAINYGGRGEIVDVTRKLTAKVLSGEIRQEDIDEELFSKHLYSPDLPDPDLLIRTAGEMRLSNFLLWELAYSEIYVTDVLWPDFNKDELIKAIVDYQGRTRRFGKVVSETQEN